MADIVAVGTPLVYTKSAATPASGAFDLNVPTGIVAGDMVLWGCLTVQTNSLTTRPTGSLQIPTLNGFTWEFTTNGVAGVASVAGMDLVVAFGYLFATGTMTTLPGGAWSGTKRWIGVTAARRNVDPTTPFNAGQRVTARNNNTQNTLTVPPLVTTGTGNKEELFFYVGNPQYGNPPGTISGFPGGMFPSDQANHISYFVMGGGESSHAAPNTYTTGPATFSFAADTASPPPSPVPNRAFVGAAFALNATAAGVTTVHSSGAWLIDTVDPVTVGTTRVVVPSGGGTASPGAAVLSYTSVVDPAPLVPVVVSGGGTVTPGAPQISVFTQIIGTPTVVAPALAVTEWIYARLPQAYRDADEAQERDLGYAPLKGFLSTLGDPMSEVNVLYDRLAGNVTGTSELVDPDAADPGWLPWLAQLCGVELDPSDTVAEQRAKIAAWDDTPRGSRAGVVDAAVALLTGAKIVRVDPHHNGDVWTVALHTRTSETPDAAAMVAAAQAAAPAGVGIIREPGVATWGDWARLYPTWGDWNAAGTWQAVQDTLP